MPHAGLPPAGVGGKPVDGPDKAICNKHIRTGDAASEALNLAAAEAAYLRLQLHTGMLHV